MSRTRRAVVLLATGATLLVVGACGNEEAGPTVTTGDLTISRVFAGSYGARTAAAYLEIANSGADDALVAVSSPDAGSVEPMGAMAPGTTDAADGGGGGADGGTVVPGGGSIAFTPGGAHLMVEGLRSPLEAGGSLALRLEFERAPAVEVVAEVVDVADIPDLMAGE
ncbi:copper chaperone PCu(A)C [Dermatobacter hominis]|uniref:copper chaperone PCu(A)C n=1 Tax=Dermatobacter hominis TaxID=2884263 RepID=UPI001D129BC6|nr:copper chaperone PCu(A)C [Dermatobacter hominis]UDY36536.1 copper chaperone PCu(A)C [Dermatobacter hominis]